uniref:Uncharacterized protein n=1 Tax=Anguilla anguilla TaxID=7936 RepID=A0A0E9SYC2_ANGAN
MAHPASISCLRAFIIPLSFLFVYFFVYFIP